MDSGGKSAEDDGEALGCGELGSGRCGHALVGFGKPESRRGRGVVAGGWRSEWAECCGLFAGSELPSRRRGLRHGVVATGIGYRVIQVFIGSRAIMVHWQ